MLITSLRTPLAVIALACCFSGMPAPIGAQSPNPSDAPLRPGDRVLIRVWADSAFADSARVDQVNHVALPMVGRVAIAGLSAPAVIDSIRAAYGQTLRGSAVEVIPLRRVTLSGELRQPGVYFLEPQVTLREAVAVAGGVTEIGTGTLEVSRDSARLRIGDWARRADRSMIIQSGDVIWVPRQSWIRRNAFAVVSSAGVLTSIILSLTR